MNELHPWFLMLITALFAAACVPATYFVILSLEKLSWRLVARRTAESRESPRQPGVSAADVKE